MDVSPGARQRTDEEWTMTSMRAQFLAELREHVDAWHSGEMDFTTFTACRNDTWEAIEKAGPAIKSEVLRALRDQLPIARAGVPSGMTPHHDPKGLSAG